MSARTIFLVDDDAEFRESVRKTLGRAFSLTSATSEAEFNTLYRPHMFDLVILDLRLKTGREGLRLLRQVLDFDELQPVIMVSAYGDTDTMLDSYELGALRFLHKRDLTPELLTWMVESVLRQAEVQRHLAALVKRVSRGDSSGLALRENMPAVQKACDNPDAIVVVGGDIGSGHDLVAEAVHDRSRIRSAAPLITTGNLNAEPHSSWQKLYGEPVQKTSPRRKGLLEQANRGVLFFPAFDRVPSEHQSRILAAVGRARLDLEGSGMAIPLDVQLVLGTSRECTTIVADFTRSQLPGTAVIEIHLPALRGRKDIALLATSLLQEHWQEGRTLARTFTKSAVNALEKATWRGNLLELKNAVEFAAVQASIEGSDEITEAHLPANVQGTERTEGNPLTWDHRFHQARAEVALVEQAIVQYSAASKAQLAELLGYHRTAIGRKIGARLKRYPQLEREFPRAARAFNSAG